VVFLAEPSFRCHHITLVNLSRYNSNHRSLSYSLIYSFTLLHADSHSLVT
jgi:hypothetical protein